MDKKFTRHYERELGHLRQHAYQFARDYPKIAGRLSLKEFECADPYVERLLEGFAYLAARVQLKIDEEFPRFTEALLDTVYPQYLAPMPSMCIVHFEPDLGAGGDLVDGFRVPRGQTLNTSLHGRVDDEKRTPCTYRTASEVTLWPIRITDARYLVRELSTLKLDIPHGAKATFQVRLESVGGPFDATSLDELVFHLKGDGGLASQIFEQVVGHGCSVAARPAGLEGPNEPVFLDGCPIECVGLDDEDALLPVGSDQFQPYRLFQEYFAMPQRFHFFRVKGLDRAVRACSSRELDLFIFTARPDHDLDGERVTRNNFLLNCAPAINLVERTTERITLDGSVDEHHVVVDRTRNVDYEIYSVSGVRVYGVRSDEDREFRPFYAATDFDVQGHRS
ncbi:MAG: type VI secretion system baseplate subunit TssF, partial [Verrucomicrobiota bacterium]